MLPKFKCETTGFGLVENNIMECEVVCYFPGVVLAVENRSRKDINERN